MVIIRYVNYTRTSERSPNSDLLSCERKDITIDFFL